jgi:tetratricopeptide (TPR) repeat protein
LVFGIDADGGPGPMARRTTLVLLCLCAVGNVQTVAAAPTRVSASMARALKLYGAGKYHDASVLFFEVSEGRTKDAQPARRRAELWLGKALYRLGLYVPALKMFDRIAQQGTTHAYYIPTLNWLAALARVLPEPSAAIRRIGAYAPGALGSPQLVKLRDELATYLGRHRYRQGAFPGAAALLHSVSARSPFVFQARFFEGLVHVRTFKLKLAGEAFKDVLRAARTQPATPESRRLEELALLGLARLFYSVRQHRLAIKYYDKIPRSSPHHSQALFEQSWACFRSGAFHRALTNLRAVQAGGEDQPEAWYLEAVIHHENCRYRQAAAAISRFRSRFSALPAKLTALVGRHADPVEFFRWALKLRQKSAGLDVRIGRLARRALGDRELERHLDQVDEIDREKKLVLGAPATWRAKAVAGMALQALTLQRSLAANDAGTLAQMRLRRKAQEIQSLTTWVRQLETAIATARRTRPPAGCDRLRNKPRP